MKLRLLFLFFFVTLALPAFAAAQVNSTSTATTTQRAPRPDCVITASPGAVYVGQSVTLRWDSRYATRGTITSLGSVGPSGAQNVIPTANAHTFVGEFAGPGGTGFCSVDIGILQGIGGGAGGGAGGGSGGIDGAPVSTQIRSGAGLIPCTGTDCQACHLAGLAQNIINWLVGISIPLAAAMFAYAGVIYFTAGGGSIFGKTVSNAHKIFTNVGIGFLIVITAWLGIQTILKTVLAPGFYKDWNEIKCVADSQRPKDKTIQQMLAIIPGLNTLVPATSPASFNDRFSGEGASATGPTPSCGGGGFYYTTDGAESNCFNPDTGEFKEPTYSYSNSNVSNAEMASQIAAACSQYGMGSAECAYVNSIAMNESSGGANCTTSRTGAAGCMQVLATTACGLDPSISLDCGACLSSKNSISSACAPVIQTISNNSQLGTNLGVQYYNQMYNQFGGSCQLAAAAYFQGPGNVKKYGGVPPNAIDYVNKACK